MGSGNWIIDNLQAALDMWNDRIAEIWSLLTQSPQSFKGGAIWDAIVDINGGLKAICLQLGSAWKILLSLIPSLP